MSDTAELVLGSVALKREGGVGIFGFADLANFWFCFRFSHLKTAAFWFWCQAELS